MKKLTVMLDDKLYKAVKVEAARKEQKLKDFVADALVEWLEIQEDMELGPLAEEAMEEYRREGGKDAEEMFREMDAKRKSA